jgi:hypothetical protein
LAHAAGKGRGWSSIRSSSISTRPSQSIAVSRIMAVMPVADGHQAFADIGPRRHAHAQPVSRDS